MFKHLKPTNSSLLESFLRCFVLFLYCLSRYATAMTYFVWSRLANSSFVSGGGYYFKARAPTGVLAKRIVPVLMEYCLKSKVWFATIMYPWVFVISQWSKREQYGTLFNECWSRVESFRRREGFEVYRVRSRVRNKSWLVSFERQRMEGERAQRLKPSKLLFRAVIFGRRGGL